MPETNWKFITKAPRACGPLLLRTGSGNLDGVFIGHQDPDDGRWYSSEGHIVLPRYFAQIPLFDCEEGA
ncbi:hypothetical protein [Bradyrhizobium sp.]|uniref:hypothetical protein n=1 Tax=Bradyrhizobium sp. TaxID=376 RepID=UPI002DDCBF9C|nr:hypothetical protein [Bradyrhizobium sp.]HEV2159569.1 hypothetical protein [Bradyrhizobium sp.]